MPRIVNDPEVSDRAVFSVPVKLRDVDMAEVRAVLERIRGRSVVWYEVIEYLCDYWRETRKADL